MNEITLNGDRYVSFEEYQKLKNEMNFSDYLIKEESNVMGIVPINNNMIQEEGWLDIPFPLPNDRSKKGLNNIWKKVENNLIIPSWNYGELGEIITISKTKFSTEWIMKAKKMASILFTDKMEFYMPFDKQQNKYIENNPVLIKFDILVFILAPRIKDDN